MPNKQTQIPVSPSPPEFLTEPLVQLHPLLGVEVPVQDLLVLYECAALTAGQLPPELLVLQQVQEVEAVRVPGTGGRPLIEQ